MQTTQPEAKPAIAVLERLTDRFEPLLAGFEVVSVDPSAAATYPDARGLITTGGAGADAGLIARLPQLEIIAVDGVGYDAVDLEAARAAGLRVTNTPDVLTEDVADLAIGLIIDVHRRLSAGDRYVRDGRWEAEGSMRLARRASGRRLGILGYGRIGAAIAARAEPMMTSITYTGRRPREDVPYRYVPGVVELAAETDILVVAVPGGAATAGLVNLEVLEALGPEGVLINVARGSVVDEAALIDALQMGRLGGAGLDVFADEPRVPEALKTLENVVLQPHVGSATIETRAAMADLVVANLRAHFAGRPLPTPVL